MQRETATIFLPLPARARRMPFARVCTAPWHRWTRGAIARAERSADGRVHLVVVRPRREGVGITVTGVGAAQAETLAPIASRIRRALLASNGSAPAGTSAFEDAVHALLDELAVPDAARRRLARLGARCPAAPGLRTMPDPIALLAPSRAVLAHVVGSRESATRLQALARAFAAMTPSVPTRA